MHEYDNGVSCLRAFDLLGELVEDLIAAALFANRYGTAGRVERSLAETAAGILERCYASDEEREAHRVLFALSQQVVIPARAYSPDPFVSVQTA